MIILGEEYDANSIIDIEEDIRDCLENSDIEQDEYGMMIGIVKITVEYIKGE